VVQVILPQLRRLDFRANIGECSSRRVPGGEGAPEGGRGGLAPPSSNPYVSLLCVMNNYHVYNMFMTITDLISYYHVYNMFMTILDLLVII
jgi:hypothetical protein